MSQCAQHDTIAAKFRCDGCASLLCGQCIEESHALLLCRLCGERALPLAADQPSNVKEIRKQRKLAQSDDYGFVDALGYPFRGTGVYLYVATFIVTGIAWPLFRLLWPVAFLTVLLISALQFRIIRKTTEGENELPDWPDFTNVGQLFLDWLTWNVINAVQWLLVILYLLRVDEAEDVNLGLGLGALVVFWLGTAFAVMAYGAAGNYMRRSAFQVHHHFRGFLDAGADAVKITTFVFALAIGIYALDLFLAFIPILGWLVSHAVAVYWIFLLPHLSGMLFRSHSQRMDELYWPYGAA